MIGRAMVLGCCAFLLAGVAPAANILTFSGSHNLGVASQGDVFSAQLSPTGSNGTFAMSGALPPGLQLVTAGFSGYASPSFYIQGVPGFSGTQSFVVSITDNLGNTGSGLFTIFGSSVYIDRSDAGGYPMCTATSVSRQLVAAGGYAPYTWTSPNLPPGLALSSSGLLTGTPLATGFPFFDANVVDAVGNPATARYYLEVTGAALTTTSLPNANAGSQYTAMLATAGTPVAFQIYGLPQGLTLNTTSGLITGTPAVAGSYVLDVLVYDQSGNVFGSWVPLTVQGSAPRRTFTGSPIYAVTPSGGTVGIPYSYELCLAGCNTGGEVYTMSLVTGSQLPPGLSLVTGAQAYPYMERQPYLLRGTPTQAGDFTFALQLADAFGNVGQQTYRLSVGSGVILPYGNVAEGLRGAPYQQQLIFTGACSGCVYNLDFGSLPAGLALSSSGLISGTPTDSGEYDFRITYSNATQTIREEFSLVVYNTASGYLTLGGNHSVFDPQQGVDDYTAIASSQLADIAIGYPNSLEFGANGGCSPCSWSVLPGSQLPPGMSLTPTQLAYIYLSGTPITPGTYTFTLQASNASGQAGVRTFHVTVSPLGSLFDQNQLAPGQPGTPYLQVLQGQYGAPPYQFSLVPGSFLPAGLQLLANGELTGVPQSAGAFVFGFTITDSSGYTLTQTSYFYIYPLADYYPLTASEGTFPIGDVAAGANYVIPLGANGIGPFTWSFVSGTLPPGSTLGSVTLGTPPVTVTALYGTAPAVPGNVSALNYTFYLKVTDARGQSVTNGYAFEDYRIQISPDSLPPGALGVPYSQQLTASNGTAPYTFSIFDGSLCPGLSLNPAGLISGTPTSVCTNSVYLAATDSTGALVFLPYTSSAGPPTSPTSALSVTPSVLTVNYTIGDPLPSPLPLQVAGAPQSIAYAATTSGQNWLSVTGSGTTPGQLTVTVNPAGLTAGSQSATITIAAPQAYNSPQTVQVNLNVSNPTLCTYQLDLSGWNSGAAGDARAWGVNTGPSCPWSVSVLDPTWITLVGPFSTVTGPGAFSYSLSPNSGAVRSSGIVVTGTNFSQTFSITQFGLTCSYSLPSPTFTVSAAGGGNSVLLNVYGNAAGNALVSNCPWTVSGGASWTTVGQTSGTGSTYIPITVANNTGAARSTTLTIGGQTYTINQAAAGCTYSLSATSDSLPATGGTGRTIAVTAPSGCAWTTAAPSWITITSGASGTGNGTVTYNVAPNSTTQLFQGTMVIASQYVTISEGGLTCNYTVNGANPVLQAGGGSGTLAVSASAAGCGWVASSDSTWLTVNPSNAPGSASLTYTATANAGSGARTGNLTVAGQGITVTQSGTVCSVQLAGTSATVVATGGSGVVNSIGVVAPSGCAWSALVTAGTSFVTIASGSGSGNGSITYSVADNSGTTARSATIAVTPGGAFTVSQPAPLVCTYTPNYPGNATNATADWPGGSSSFTYTASSSSCPTPTVQSFSSWLTVQSSSYGSGNGTVSYQVAQTWASVARTGYIVLNDTPFTLIQALNPCTYSLDSTQSVLSAAGGTGTIAITASQNSCTPYITPDPNLTGVNLSGSGGNFSLSFTVPPFQPLVPSTRVLNIDIGPGQTYSAKQVSQ